MNMVVGNSRFDVEVRWAQPGRTQDGGWQPWRESFTSRDAAQEYVCEFIRGVIRDLGVEEDTPSLRFRRGLADGIRIVDKTARVV